MTVTSRLHTQEYRDRELNIVIDESGMWSSAVPVLMGMIREREKERKVGFTENTATRHDDDDVCRDIDGD